MVYHTLSLLHTTSPTIKYEEIPCEFPEQERVECIQESVFGEKCNIDTIMITATVYVHFGNWRTEDSIIINIKMRKKGAGR